uniref:Thioredoxin domain-containing protein n=1 Tax=Hanusia phi TaxID=3032 RepID=A0A7S0DVD4_9CRYP|mmetsp:Transcript_11171/g.25332  ORF Transcript_11171/g.25332 Transcript_11171/m.25332 type:complete len:157 (+) Transcript_11171:99-569(+)|eukprot:765164-Hanusia_phi.AAC.2
MEKFFGPSTTLVTPRGALVPVQSLKENDLVGLYFSAEWCSACKRFTPTLVDAYSQLRSQGKKMEVVFLSGDRTETDFTKYFHQMPWVALPFAQRDIKEAIEREIGADSLPTLVLIDPCSGAVLSKNGRKVILEDPCGEGFPWRDLAKKKNDACCLQ